MSIKEDLIPNARNKDTGDLVRVVGDGVQLTYAGLGSRFVKGIPWQPVRTRDGVITVINAELLEPYEPPPVEDVVHLA